MSIKYYCSKMGPPPGRYTGCISMRSDMDMYEVTTARYATFLKAIGPDHPELVPAFWDEVHLPYDADRPVVGVSWNAAEAYCLLGP